MKEDVNSKKPRAAVSGEQAQEEMKILSSDFDKIPSLTLEKE